VFGTLCGLFSAVGYTVANACLRAVSDCDPIWVSAVKALPTLVMVGPWIAWQARRGTKILPELPVLGLLVMGALIGQLIGNVVFQWSLGVVGLALAVPLTLGTIILGGALMGRTLLHEPLTVRMLASVVTLIAAITVLSLGAGDAHRSVAGPMLQGTAVVFVNALNATQATMAAIAGVLIFHEAPSPELAFGVLLTIAGLLLMKQRKRFER